MTTTSDSPTTTYRPAYEPPSLPDLSPAAELALLVRVLARHGYDDVRAGHVTVRQPDGTLLINPRELCWPEVRASDVVTIDADGVKLSGRYNPTIAAGIHFAVRRRRPGTGVVLHNHPRWAVVWGDCLRIPPIFDQTSACVAEQLTLVDEYEGDFTGPQAAADAAAALGDSEWALLANHGVLITAPTIAHAFVRAYTLEWRCQRAWEVETLGGGRPMGDAVARRFGHHFESSVAGWWEAALRMELRRDPTVLD